MSGSALNIWTIANEFAELKVTAAGGSIVSFRLHSSGINPLSFSFPADDMPANNRKGAPYRGHFSCIGRWGPPSEGERKNGLPDHGDFTSIDWQLTEHDDFSLRLQATSQMEGLQVNRSLIMQRDAPVVNITDTITNIASLGRIYQLVQHPTIAAPFLNPDTIVTCNATTGYHYAKYEEAAKYALQWGDRFSSSREGHSAVYCFIVDPQDEKGWITASDPRSRLQLSYIWNRHDYAWINHWLDFKEGTIRYRGLEFGNTGIHQPAGKILASKCERLFGEPTIHFIDAGETIVKSFDMQLRVMSG